MQRVKMENGETKYADSRKYQVGEFYENWAMEIWYVITSAERAVINGEKTWVHTMREATNEELAQREAQIAEWNSKTSDERISETVDTLSNVFSGLDW